MDSLVHPTQLSVWQRFLQARRLHKETSRSKNPDWFRSALELDYQLHLFVEGDQVANAQLCSQQGSTKVWSPVAVPSLDLEGEALESYVAELRAKLGKGKARSLGIVLHLADEFAISELSRASERPEDLTELAKQLVGAPQEVLEDHSIPTEELSHRLFPYSGAQAGQQFGAAITLSRKHHGFLQRFRAIGASLNFPILTTALSAPLVALTMLPHFSEQLPVQPFCIFLSYSNFSVIAFFTAEGDLVMLRSVRHHTGGTPPHVGRIIQTMAAALELPEPTVFVIALSPKDRNGADAWLPRLPQATTLCWRNHPLLDPEVPLEFQGTTGQTPGGEQAPRLAGAKTFKDLAESQWATQDFLPPTPEESELHPSQLEMKALRAGGIVLRAGAALLVLFLAWTGVRAFQVLRDPAWHSQQSNGSIEGNKVLAAQIKRYEQWDSFLADRSKAWVTMELLNQLFPNPNSVVLSETKLDVRPEVVRDQARASLVKEWVINGFVNDEALEHLTVINTREGINKAFEAVYGLTGDESLRTDLESRNLVVNMLASENKRFNPESGTTAETQFPFIFTLTITQQVSAEDPIAIPTIAAP